jgi:hypothetical protein
MIMARTFLTIQPAGQELCGTVGLIITNLARMLAELAVNRGIPSVSFVVAWQR